MGCCGDRRRSHYRSSGRALRQNAQGQRTRPSEEPAPTHQGARVSYRYVGQTALTVRGPISGRLYLFDRPGAPIATDPRDRRALSTVPMLRPTKR